MRMLTSLLPGLACMGGMTACIGLMSRRRPPVALEWRYRTANGGSQTGGGRSAERGGRPPPCGTGGAHAAARLLSSPAPAGPRSRVGVSKVALSRAHPTQGVPGYAAISAQALAQRWHASAQRRQKSMS
jgi:hypothetical protein